MTTEIKLGGVQINRPKELWQRSILLHGIPKIGKTTLASQFPNPVILAFEDGLGDLEVPYILMQDTITRKQIGKTTYQDSFEGVSAWELVNHRIHDLSRGDTGAQTVVIDTVDLMHSCCNRYHRIMHGVEHENDGALGYGKGMDIITRDFSESIRRLHSLPLGVIFISHSEEKEYVLADGKTKRTKIVCTLPKRAMQVVNGMVDFIFYCTFEGEDRVIKTKAGPNYDAGSRIVGLPETIPMSYEALAAAYTHASGGNGNAKTDLIRRILKGEEVLATNKVDSFEVEKRRMNAREKHAGDSDLKTLNLGPLNGYLQYLQTKYAEHKTQSAKEQTNASA